MYLITSEAISITMSGEQLRKKEKNSKQRGGAKGKSPGRL